MNAIEQLKSVLCDPEGKCCIQGSEEDRAIVDRALQALAAPVPLTDEQKVLRSLLGAALGALRYHTEQTRPIQRTNETITAIEHELAAHGITKGQP
jgi:hypothetical protein